MSGAEIFHLNALSLREKRSGTKEFSAYNLKIPSADVFQGFCVGIFLRRAPAPQDGRLQEKNYDYNLY